MRKQGLRAVLALLLRDHRGLGIGLLAVCAGYAVVEAGLVASIYPVTLGILGQMPRFDDGGIASHFWVMLQSISQATPAGGGLFLFALVSFASFAITCAKDTLRNYIALVVRRDCQLTIFRQWITADHAAVADQKQGEIVFRICGAPGGIGVPFIYLPELAAQGMKLLAVAIVLWLVSAPVALAVLGLGAGFYVFNQWLTFRYSYRVGEMKVRCLEEQHVLVNESLNGIREFQLYGANHWWIDRYRRVTDQFRRMSRNAQLVRAFPGHSLMAVVVLVGGGAVLTSGSTALTVVPVVVTAVFAAYRILPVVAESGQMVAQIRESLPNVEVVLAEIMTSRRAMDDGRTLLTGPVEAITLDRVWVRYRGRAAALSGVSVTFPRGVNAIVGRSGSGKSTLASLLVRLRDPDEGRVLLTTSSECLNLREVVGADWRGRIGFVGQDPFLLPGTVAENIAFGRSLSREVIERAAERAHAAEFIRVLPKGLETLVGDRGQQLSGGQRQRLAIARALAFDPEVLIFDEVTSGLDYESEAVVQQTIEKLGRARIIVVVAHRVSAVQRADQIIVLDHGRLVECGNHRELLARDGTYASLFRLQDPDRWAQV